MEHKPIRDLLHDARAALGVIQTTSEVVLIEPDLTSSMRESLDQIVAQVRHISDLLSQIGTEVKESRQ
jgi:methyl-accepting chemotaxis protein